MDDRPLAWPEQLYWLDRAQGTTVVQELKQFRYGKPLTVPTLDEAWGVVAGGHRRHRSGLRPAHRD